MESLLKKAYQVERVDRQVGQVCMPTLTRPLNPEDIELARKRAELNLYLEKAAPRWRKSLQPCGQASPILHPFRSAHQHGKPASHLGWTDRSGGEVPGRSQSHPRRVEL